MEKEMTMSGVMKTQEIMESQSYYGIKKAVEEGSVVRLKKVFMHRLRLWLTR